MEEEIQVGEYVRTKLGNIGKVLDITNVIMQKRKKYLIKWNMYKAYYITTLNIVKHSSNIIDLIEVGDYVNGHLVIDVDNINTGVMREVYCEDDKDMGLWSEDIKTIVTRKQFKSMEYEVVK